MLRTRYVALLSLVFTGVFFAEYLPLWNRVHISYDLEGFHYPLANYAFQALRAGRFPQWDPTIYSGLSFAGNTQAALFYPPMWLMFAAGWGNEKLPFQALQILVLAHIWLAFLLCYLWLHEERKLQPLAAALGGAVFAFSGFMLLQLQHFGLVAAYAWLPLGFCGIDAADRQQTWRPLWKLVLASAMCFLAGYPSAWVVFSICVLAYAVPRRHAVRSVMMAGAALAASLFLAAVQLLPAFEATQLRVKELKYSAWSGIKDPGFYLSYFAPNYFNFGLNVPLDTNPGREYLYLGAAAFTGLTLLCFRRSLRDALPALAVLLASLLFLINPFGLLGSLIEQIDLLAEIFSAWYFLAGVTAAIALLVALGIDHGLRRSNGRAPLWLAALAVAASLAWSAWLIVTWLQTGAFRIGSASAIDAFAGAILLGLLLLLFPRSPAPLRSWIAGAVLILVAADYKAFGTSKRFNSVPGPASAAYASPGLAGLNASVYESLRAHPEYRLALDLGAPSSLELRHVGLTTPQGFDPFLPEQYRALIERVGRFRNNREFDLLPEDADTLRLLGVGYFVSSENSPLYHQLSANQQLHQITADDSYYRVFALADPRPAFGWEDPDGAHSAQPTIWQPERRAFTVNSPSGGRFRLTEQFYPGWSATVDHVAAAIERCHEAFQCISVGPGKHDVEFRYRSRWLPAGSVISLCSLLLLTVVAFREAAAPGRR